MVLVTIGWMAALSKRITSHTSEFIPEFAARLLLKVTCVGFAFGVTGILEGHFQIHDSRLSGLCMLLAAIAAYIVLRPVAYRIYPPLGRSDRQYLKRGPKASALLVTGLFVALMAAVLDNIWYGAIALSL